MRDLSNLKIEHNAIGNEGEKDVSFCSSYIIYDF